MGFFFLRILASAGDLQTTRNPQGSERKAFLSPIYENATLVPINFHLSFPVHH